MSGLQNPRLASPFLAVLRGIVILLIFVMLALTVMLLWPSLLGRLQVGSQSTSTPLSTVTQFTSTPSSTSLPSNTAQPFNTSSPSGLILAGKPFAPFDEGLIILAMSEGGYTHLFAFQPGGLPFIRLTNGAWQDIDPAISPDGRKVAFASNRDGSWDLYIMLLETGDVTRLTDTPEYDAGPSWSSDGLWLVYESYVPDKNGGNIELFIRPTDGSQAPIRLTDDPGADYDPTWSPQGRLITFVSTRSGDSEIWVADLDRPDDRFENISRDRYALDLHPAWSPDGDQLSWASTSSDGVQNLYVWDISQPGDPPRSLGSGSVSAWSPKGDAILASLDTPNYHYLTGYNIQSGSLTLPIIALGGGVQGISWSNTSLPKILPYELAQSALLTPTPIFSLVLTPGSDIPGGRQHLVQLTDVAAPTPMLQDRVDDSFNSLRQRLNEEIGWDFLASLEAAFTPLTARLAPGMAEDWMYTGRGFRFSMAPFNAGWAVMVREDYGTQTYFRIFLRTRYQDGSQGMPLKDLPWDLFTRFSGDPRAYEQGGSKLPAIPPGYWVDFTQLAAAYGWERQPALNTWRQAYSAARANEYIYTGGLDWLTAMMEIYPRAALDTPTPVPSPTQSPIPSITPTRTLTPTRTRWSSPTPTITPTRWPTRTPTLTPTKWPTWTPTPTYTPRPTKTPTPTLTPTPSGSKDKPP